MKSENIKGKSPRLSSTHFYIQRLCKPLGKVLWGVSETWSLFLGFYLIAEIQQTYIRGNHGCFLQMNTNFSWTMSVLVGFGKQTSRCPYLSYVMGKTSWLGSPSYDNFRSNFPSSDTTISPSHHVAPKVAMAEEEKAKVDTQLSSASSWKQHKLWCSYIIGPGLTM